MQNQTLVLIKPCKQNNLQNTFFAQELIQALIWYQQTVKYVYLLMKKVASNFIAVKSRRSSNKIPSTPLTFSHLAFCKVGEYMKQMVSKIN